MTVKENITFSTQWMGTRKNVLSFQEMMRRLNNHIRRLPEADLTIYTDASQNRKKMINGVSFYIPEIKYYYKETIVGNISVDRLELIAISKALRFCEIFFPTEKILIYTDSLNSIKYLQRTDQRCNFILRMIRRCLRIKLVMFVWIPGHSNIYGNVIADRLAKVAAHERN